MKHLVTILLSGCFLFFACNSKKQPSQKSIDQLKWLSGNWQMKDSSGITT